MVPRPRTSRAGMSIIELVIAAAVAAVVVGMMGMVSSSVNDAQRTGAAISDVDSRAWRLLDRASDRIRAGGMGTIEPKNIVAPFNTSWIEFEPVIAYTNGAPTLGPKERIAFEYNASEIDDGVDNDGNGLIDDGRVVWTQNVGLAGERRTILCNEVREWLEGEIPGNGLDDNGNGLRDEPGFCINYDGNSVTVHISLEKWARGFVITRTVERTTRIRNGGA